MFRNKYHLCSHFLEYASLVKAVKTYIYDTLSITNTRKVIITNPIFPFKLELFLITTKGCKEMYNILNKSTIIPTAQTKYSNLGYMLSAQEWRNVYKIPFQCGAGRSSEVERSLMVRWVVGSILHGVDPLSYFSFQPVLHDWCNKGCCMYYPVCGMVHIKEPLLLIDKSSLCGGSGFPF